MSTPRVLTRVLTRVSVILILSVMFGCLFALASTNLALAQQHQHSKKTTENGNAKLEFLRIGTSPPDETLYRLGSALTASLSAPPDLKPPCRENYPCGVPGLLLVTQSRTGSFESLEDMARGVLESAVVSADVIKEIVNSTSGTYSFDASEINLLAHLASVQLHIVVLKESNIKSLKDLQNRSIAVGISGSAYALQLRQAMLVLGENFDATLTLDLPLHEALDKLAQGQIDALAITAQAPMPILQNFARKNPMRLLDLQNLKVKNSNTQNNQNTQNSQNIQNNQKQDAPQPTILPAKTYIGQEKDINTLEFNIWWVVSKKLDSESVYRITKALWHSSTQNMVRQLVPEARIEKPRALQLMSSLLTIHPGAARWYREKGLLAL